MTWSIVPIGTAARVVSGATPSTSCPEYWGGRICWASPKDISELNGSKFLDDTPRKLTEAGLRSCSAEVLPPNSVLFSSRAPIGLVAINRVPTATNQGFKSFVPDPSKLDAGYLFHWLKAHRAQIERMGVGATFREVSKAIVSRIQIPIPPIDDQRRIAAILDEAEELRAKRRAAIALLDQLPQAIFLEMFGDLRINSRNWQVLALGEFAKVQIGPFGSLLHQHDYVEGGIPIVNPKHIQGCRIETTAHETIRDAKFKKLSTYQLEANDIVMGRRGEMGRCAVVSYKALPLLCGTGSLLIRPNSNRTTSLFLQIVLSGETVKRRLEHASIGQTLPNLNSGIVEKLTLPLPPLDLQLDFATRIEAIDRTKAGHQSALVELDALFASLQATSFSGSTTS